MAITATERAEFSDTSNATTYTTASFTPGSGTILVVCVGSVDSATDDLPTLSDSLGDISGANWHQIRNQGYTDTDIYNTTVFWGKTTSASARTITATFGNAQTGCLIHVLELSGTIHLTSPVARSNGYDSLAGVPNVSLPAAPAGTSVVYATSQVRRNNPGSGWTDEGGWTNHADFSHGTPAHALHVSTKTADQTWTASGTNGTHSALIIEFQEASATAITRSFTFDGGAAGTTVTASDTGSGDQFDLVDPGSAGSITYEVAAAARGPLGARFDAGPTGDSVFCRWQVSESNSSYFRAYSQFPVARPATSKVVYRARCSDGTLKAALRFASSGKIVLLDAGSVARYTSAKAFGAGEPFRVEVHFVHSNTVGHMQARLFYGANIHGTTPDESLGNLTDSLDTQGTATGTDYIEFGWCALTTNDVLDFDEVAWSTVDWLGPASATAGTGIVQVSETNVAQAVTVSLVGNYHTPQPNTDPNNFGTIDQTLDPSMSDATIQTKIDQAGVGGVVFWSGSTYTIGTNLRFLAGQKHYGTQGNPPLIKITNTANMASFVDMRSPKGGGPSSDNVTISDLEIWGHVNVPSRPPLTAPVALIIPYTGTFLRRVILKGAQSAAIKGQGDRKELGVIIDTCELAYNVANPPGTGADGGMKMHFYGVCGSPVGSTMKLLSTRVHHNWLMGAWWDISSNGVLVANCEIDNNAAAGVHIETCGGPFLVRDNYVHHNGGGGDLPNVAGPNQGIRVVSSDNGQIINNTVSNSGGYGIGFFQDMDPASRTSMRCPQVGNAGDGYWFDDWDVFGNVLSGGDTVNNEVTSNPAIHYSTAPVVNALLEVITTDTVQAVNRVKTATVNQVLESDETLALVPLRAPLTLGVSQVFETDLPQAVVHTPFAVAVNQVVESDDVLPSVTLQKVMAVSQVTEAEEAIGVVNPGITAIRAIAAVGVAAARSAVGRLASRATTGSRVAFTTVGRLSTNKSAAGALVPRTAASSLLTHSTTGALRAVATTANFTIKRAEDAVITFTLNSTDGTTPQNISGWTLAFRAGSSQYGAATITKTPTITNAAQGIFTVTLASTDTSSLTQDGADTIYFYDVRRTDTGSRAELFEGTLTVQDTYTNG